MTAIGSPLGARRTASIAVLVAAAAVGLVTLFGAAGSSRLAADFHATYIDAAESLRANGTPWDAGAEFPYLYPPLVAELVVPLTYVPEEVASFLAFLASLAALLGTLRVLGVTDVRCYAAVLIWAPAWNAVELANVTVVLLFLAALAWRYRNSTWSSAGAIGGSLALKVLLWPLVVWAAAMGRTRAAGLAVGFALAITIVTWGAIGFVDVTSYPDRLREIRFETTFSLVGVAASLGLDPTIGRVAMAATGGTLVGAVVYFGRQRDDVRAFVCAMVATLALTPVLRLHYLVLLVAPLAVARPRFSAIWLVPILLWVCPRDGNGDGLQPYLPALVLLLFLVALLADPREHGRPAEVTA